MGILSTTIDSVFGRLGYVRAKPEDVVKFDVRNGAYAINELLYSGSVYQTRANGGALEDILRTYIGPAFTDANRNRILPLFNPVAEIVETYQHVLPGTWGDGVTLADKVNDRPIDQAIREPLANIWKASNFDSEKAKLIRWGANFGTVGIRVVARGARDNRPSRVSIVADHPSRLFNFEEDGEGNVVAVCLKYQMPVNRGTLADPTWETVDVVEEITREGFSLTYDGAEQIEDADRANGLGFCPYVVLKHRDNGTAYGDWAYRGSEAALHRINWRYSRQDKSIDRHQFPNWFFAAGGDAPIEDVDMGDSKGHYVKTVAGTPPPVMQAIVPDIDQGSAMEFVATLRKQFRSRQPELVLNDLELLANTSGDSLELSLKAAEKKIADAKPNYIHAITRALQMGVSAGNAVGAWPIGGDQDYRAGRLDFAFSPMPLLPLTTSQRALQAAADVAGDKAKLEVAQQAKLLGLPQKEQWRKAGYTEPQIATLLQERSDQPVLDTEDDGVGGAA